MVNQTPLHHMRTHLSIPASYPIFVVVRLIFPALLTLIMLSANAQIKPTPATERIKSMEQRRLLHEKSMLKELSFRNIGPSVMSGRVVDLEVNPNDPTEFYVAYATGGLWHTTNNGQSFKPIFDSEDVLFIGDIAVNWSSSGTENRLIWVGTGEVNSSRSSYAGIGVYKSSNGGKSWVYVGLPESHHIGKVLLHPTNKNIAWVAALGHLYSPNKERGIYKTTDGGISWKQTLYIDENTGVVELEMNPANPDELYAGAWYRTRSAWNFEESGPSSALLKSVDGGNTWKKLNVAGSGFPDGAGVGRIGISIYPKNPSIVYAILDNNTRRPDTASRKDASRYVLRDFEKLTQQQFLDLDNAKLDSFLRQNRMPRQYTASYVKEQVRTNAIKPTAVFEYLFDANTALFDTPITGCEVYRSDDAGLSWKKTNEKDIPIFNTYGYYFGKIYVSPADENKVVILGIDAQLSTDGGKTFKTIDKENVHADHHALWINPNRDSHMINGNDGGINITYDNGDTWFKANTPPVGQFYAITVDDAKPYNVYGGLQDNGVWFGPSNNRESLRWTDNGRYAFRSLVGGDGMQVQVDTRDNETVYAGSQFGFYSRRGKELSRPHSIRPRHILGQSPYRFNWQTPILLSRHNQDILYYGSNKFHRSLNRGDSLHTLSEDLTSGGKPGDVPFGTLTTISESPFRFGLLYAGTDDGHVHLSKDGGSTWTKISNRLPQGLWVSRVVASRHNAERVYVTLNGYRNDHFLPYLFVSDDMGTNWRPIGKDLPFEPVNVVVEDPKQDSILYVGSDGGLYVSIDAGNSFMMWNKGLPKSVPVHDIAIQERENEIVLGTHGRSLYISKIDSVQMLITNRDYRQMRSAEVTRTLAISHPTGGNDLFSREGIEVECPPARLPKKTKAKKSQVVIN